MSAVTDVQTRTSICDRCPGAIEITVGPGQRWNDVTWKHLEPYFDRDHQAWPEVRASIDATCPACKYPEIGFAFERDEFVCSRCDHVQSERPAA